MVVEQGIKSINLYDVFANILPGLIFIFGLAIPFDVSEVLILMLGEEVMFEFGIPEFLILITLAFVIGQILQVAGGIFDGDHGFDTFMWEIRGKDVNSRIDISDFDTKFWDMCRHEFQLSGEFNSHNRLFQALLSFLEERERSRALRMQALYLFARGLYMTILILTVIYALIGISLYFDYIDNEWLHLFRSIWAFWVAIISAWILSIIVNNRREEYEVDWIEYTVTECYLEMVDDW